MDRYEYKLKLEKITNFYQSGEYTSAASFADEINWGRVRSVRTLSMVGKVYMKLNRYQDAKQMFELAYSHNPSSRSVLNYLAQICIELKIVEEAEEFYQEFEELSPRSNTRYILQYKLANLKNASDDEKIRILEAFKKQDEMEEYSLELAKLYDKVGRIEDCIDTCDDLILWFGDGEYVKAAMELKMVYRPLSPSQEAKYKKIQQAEAENVLIAAEVEQQEESTEETKEATEENESQEDAGVPEDAFEAESVTELESVPEAEEETAKDAFLEHKEEIVQQQETEPVATIRLTTPEIDRVESALADISSNLGSSVQQEKIALEPFKTRNDVDPEYLYQDETVGVINTLYIRDTLNRHRKVVKKADSPEVILGEMTQIAKLVEDIPFLKAIVEEEKEYQPEKINEEVDQAVTEEFHSSLAREETAASYWDKTKVAAEIAIADAEEKKTGVIQKPGTARY